VRRIVEQVEAGGLFEQQQRLEQMALGGAAVVLALEPAAALAARVEHGSICWLIFAIRN
jgi:hypothetical protein